MNCLRKIRLKKKTKKFFRSFVVSSVVIFCVIFALIGFAKAYENIRRIGFGEYRKAVEINSDGIKFYDWYIEF